MSKPKIIAFYLPQFHPIPENDEWWGKGFTEWTNLRNAKSLFDGHNQPRIPFNNNYYDLLNPSTFEWQVKLAKNYSINGFCFYHYWFNGKLLLEKPIEMYKDHKEWDLSYCFSWANEPWTRSWDGLNKSILMPQTYGGLDDIKNHFNYLLPFFKDDRYIKIENKPVFLLYRANTITYLDEMIQEWNNLALSHGFNGIFIVETLTGYQIKKKTKFSNASVYFEPTFSNAKRGFIRRSFQKIKSKLQKFPIMGLNDYLTIWKAILHYEKLGSLKWGGAFTDWDNTPRKGLKGYVFFGASAVLFEKYFKKLYKMSTDSSAPFIFINAWNEWCEGAYLEPDSKNGYKFLEVIRRSVNEN